MTCRLLLSHTQTHGLHFPALPCTSEVPNAWLLIFSPVPDCLSPLATLYILFEFCCTLWIVVVLAFNAEPFIVSIFTVFLICALFSCFLPCLVSDSPVYCWPYLPLTLFWITFLHLSAWSLIKFYLHLHSGLVWLCDTLKVTKGKRVRSELGSGSWSAVGGEMCLSNITARNSYHSN